VKPQRTMSMAELLDQDEVWHARDRWGELEELRLAEMDTRHLANLRTWLLRNAYSIKQDFLSSLYGCTSMVSGEIAADDLDREIDRLEAAPPREWMDDQPLFEAITQLLAERLEEIHGSPS
jgi:hypothetical protein